MYNDFDGPGDEHQKLSFHVFQRAGSHELVLTLNKNVSFYAAQKAARLYMTAPHCTLRVARIPGHYESAGLRQNPVTGAC